MPLLCLFPAFHFHSHSLLSLSFSLSVCLSLSFSASVCLSLSASVCLSVSLSLCLCLSASLSLCLCLPLSLFLTLKSSYPLFNRRVYIRAKHSQSNHKLVSSFMDFNVTSMARGSPRDESHICNNSIPAPNTSLNHSQKLANRLNHK